MGHGRLLLDDKMARRGGQIEKEIRHLREEIQNLATRKNTIEQVAESESVPSSLIKYMTEERERTNKLLASIMEKVNALQKELDTLYGGEAQEQQYAEQLQDSREIPLSELDTKILNFVQLKGMVCADDVRTFMKYNGRNAACARLNKLHKDGLVDRIQLGHKVYYKYDAGKTTNTLIISPPQ